ncbi:tyrosine-type recombinase/integrase [Seohaeicola nanhaiensis]|uniref:Tyrosine-type recombinase/integrase n=1 Tax=Seohaeicola nanhaiensis TaxID=1387282 RepID=A0ABV9KE57_9RHOB
MTIGRLRGGFCVIWRDGGKRHRHQLKARTRKEAEAEGLDLYRRENYRPIDATVQGLWTAYVETLAGRPTAETMRHTGKAILPHFGHLRHDQIEMTTCKEYERLRCAAGISQGSIHTELGHLRSTLRFAEDARMIPKAPRIWRPAKPIYDKRILNAGEARALIEAANAPHISLALILLLGTAGRVGAVLELEWDRIDFDRGEIRLRTDDAQTRKGRANVPMNAMTRAALQTAQSAALSDYVIEYAGGPVKSVKTGISAAVRRAKIGHVRIHDLRHTAAVTMLSNGVPLEMVSQMLGHSNTQITYSTYARYLPQHMQKAADVLNFTAIRSAS